MRVVQLRPGDVIDGATYIAQCPHPIWRRLQLVVWRLPDGGWSHDALSPAQEVGEPRPASDEHRMTRLRAALLGGGARR